MQSKLYLDVDDVILDTAKYVRARAKEDNLEVPENKSIYGAIPPEVQQLYLSEYEKIPFKNTFSYYIGRVKSLFDKVTLISEYYSEGERDSKLKKMSSLFAPDQICLIDARLSRKYEKDLSDGILVDDNVTILDKVKAKRKICFWCPDTSIWNYNGDIVKNNHKVIYTWSDLYAELLVEKILLF